MTNNRKPVKVLPAACISGTAISSMGMAAPPPVESTAVPAPQPSQRTYLERAPVRGNTLPEFNRVSAAVKGNESLSLCRLLCCFCVCCYLSSLETIYKPVLQLRCLQPHWSVSAPQGFTPPKVSGERSKGQCGIDLEWKIIGEKTNIWMMAVLRQLQEGGGVQRWHFWRGEITVDSREWRAACKNKLPHTSMLTEWLSYLKNLLRGKINRKPLLLLVVVVSLSVFAFLPAADRRPGAEILRNYTC